ncbi:hypothetical protein ES332_D09G095500v1 [Gossypium tomentosum]|uniref:RING-type domain-containing protein n=1 Tax=Gossypium tomentosum TaxID=34277 RepID=A0A5D2JFZ3_GOSTO|nr:hypothetical protein ES332_D09G095500v1 [Gossypium tomentosum]
MAIESQHTNQNLPPQLIINRYFMKTNEGMYKDNLMDSCVPLQQASFAKLFDPILASNSIADMGMRRRPKDSFINNAFGSSMYHIQLPQLDGFIAQHSLYLLKFGFDLWLFTCSYNAKLIILKYTCKFFQQVSMKKKQRGVRFEVEEQRENQWRTLITLIQERVLKQLKAKDEEIQRMGKINWVLQQRVKCLCVESQRWRDLARTNEAAANSLRTDLERVLAHAGEERLRGMSAAADDGGESSCCGSSEEGWREVVVPPSGAAVMRKCKKCGEGEASVVLLPCRHLCVCRMCGSAMVGTCPVCHFITNASVHVNLS